METSDPLRTHLVKLLDWQDAHVSFEAAVDGIRATHLGHTPEGVPYSLWQLLEHMRIAQQDILDFCRNPDYQELDWPADYWPADPAPPDSEAWEESVTRFREDREALKQLAADPGIDLYAKIPHGQGQTYLREVLLVADHTAYHVGQLVAVRRILGSWPGPR